MDSFADIDGPLRIGLMALIAMAGLGILIILILITVILRLLRKRTGGAGEGLVQQRSPLEIAMERLDRLQADADTMDADPFIVEVSNIVRDYLETALEIPAREQTSEEFLQAVQLKEDMPDVLKARMPQFLDQCDLVKFARQMLAATQRQTLLETAGVVVSETNESLAGNESTAEKELAAG